MGIHRKIGIKFGWNLWTPNSST